MAKIQCNDMAEKSKFLQKFQTQNTNQYAVITR